jgi:hypothetical protein
MATASMHPPPLTPRAPWHGYELGYWPDRWARAAQRPVDGEYFDTGKDYESLRTCRPISTTVWCANPEEHNPCNGND